ncbi:hypothetical protein ONZ45_g14449 [Pleurotus djamor]|nr:hypothetical protein ONZ45_g14449 [Pleurotus djamor]
MEPTLFLPPPSSLYSHPGRLLRNLLPRFLDLPPSWFFRTQEYRDYTVACSFEQTFAHILPFRDYGGDSTIVLNSSMDLTVRLSLYS